MLIVSVVEQLNCLGEENHETLKTNSAMACSRLLKKPDQCRGVAMCAHLFWSGKIASAEDETGVQVSAASNQVLLRAVSSKLFINNKDYYLPVHEWVKEATKEIL